MSLGDAKLARLYNDNVENVSLVAMKHKRLAVGTSFVELTTGLVDNRTSLYVYNDDANTGDLFIGFNNSVSSSPTNDNFGIRLKPGQGFPFQMGEGDDLKLYGISDTAAQNIVVAEGR